MTVDKSIRQTKDRIVEALNNSGLSICTMELILENVLNVVRTQADKTLLEEDPEERSENNGTE